MDKVDAEYTASWTCPKCNNPTDEIDSGIDLEDSLTLVKCKEDIDRGGEGLEICGHEYYVRRY